MGALSNSRWISLLGLFAVSAACTDRSLYGQVGQPPDLADRITLDGLLCTDNPATRAFPVKILFIVDASGQIRETAPFAEHVRAVEQVVSQYLPIAQVSVGVIRYDDGARTLISEDTGRVRSGFTRDAAILDGALADLRNGAGARDLASALSLARSIVTGDAYQADKGPLSRTKYVLVHLTAGSPEPAIPPARCDQLFDVRPPVCELAFFERAVRLLRDEVLGLGAAELAFHSLYLEQPHMEGAPCHPRGGSAVCAAGLVCLPAGVRVDTGRCVQLCDPGAPVCDASPLRGTCVTSTLFDGTVASYCARGELACFDGQDNDGDGQDRDCSDPTYPYDCNGNQGCERDCRSACRAEALGLAMARAGGGTYERVPSIDQLSLGRIDFRSTQRRFVLKELLVSNRNAIPTVNGLVPDSDGDGLSDADEERLGTDPLSPDTDGDGLGDQVEHLLRTLGLDPLVPTVLPDCDDPFIDRDGDGLGDCEERLLGTDPTLFDSDADGFPDRVELRAGTNPLVNDILEDLDLDGVPNGRELRAHTDPLSNDARVRAELAYRYRVTDLGATTDQRTCYDFRVTNVGLVSTLDRGFGPGMNQIDVYFGQVPEGDLEGFGLFYASQVRVQFIPPDTRVPSATAIDLREGDFAFFEQ